MQGIVVAALAMATAHDSWAAMAAAVALVRNWQGWLG